MLDNLSFMLLVSMFVRYSSATYRLVQDYSGDAFWQGFDFFTDPDPTDGLVQYQSLESANATGLAGFIDGDNSTYAIFMGVDAKEVAPDGRASVRVSSTQTFQHALVVADIVHMPGGVCGTWPAFWMLGADWPNNGEIDIVEGVNDQSANSMTLHTAAGPIINNVADFSGELVTPDCDVNASNQPKNAGCSIGDTSNLTFGSDFNTAGGGVFATEWTSEFIKIWFFQRGTFPDDIVSSTPDPTSNWGTPNSVFQGQFNIDDHFKDLQLVFDTTFCGQVRLIKSSAALVLLTDSAMI
jgi:beta-glucanase (GH16 family)